MEDRERRIREIAYRIWEKEGRPIGHDLRHWDAARLIVDYEAERAASEKRPASDAIPAERLNASNDE